MVVPKIQSVHDSEARNIINQAIEVLNAQGKTIQDLVADGQLTEEQYENLITTINGLTKSGEVDEYDLSPELRSKLRSINDAAKMSDLQDLQNQITLNSGGVVKDYFEGSDSQAFRFSSAVNGVTISNDAQDMQNYSYDLLVKKLWEQGSLSSANGDELDVSTRIRSKFVSVLPGMAYNLEIESPSNDYASIVIQYDGRYKFIEATEWGVPESLVINENCRYVRVILQRNNNTIDVDEVMSELSAITMYVSRINLNTNLYLAEYFYDTPDKSSDWEQGTLTSSSGSEGDSPTRIRTGFLPINPGTSWKSVWLTNSTVSDNYQVSVLEYDDNQNFIRSSGWQPNDYHFVTTTSTAFVRFLYERNGQTISPDAVFSDLKYFKIIGNEILIRSGEVFTAKFDGLKAVNVDAKIPYRLYGLGD